MSKPVFRPLACAALCLALSACATVAVLPDRSKAQCLFVIPVEVVRSVQDPLFGKYRFRVRNLETNAETFFYISPSTKQVTLSALKPGRYLIVERTFIYDSGKAGTKVETKHTFTLDEGKITILSKGFRYSSFEEDGEQYMRGEWIALTAELLKDVILRYKDAPGFEDWSFHDNTLAMEAMKAAMRETGLAAAE